MSRILGRMSFSQVKWLVISLAVLIRLPILYLIALHPERAILGSDAIQYLNLASNLASHSVFSLDTSPPLAPDAFRTPGYPVALVPLVVLFGQGPIVPIVVVHFGLSVATVCTVIRLGKRLFDETAGLLAGGLYALAPVPAIMIAFVYTETLFAFLMLVGCSLLHVGAKDDNWKKSGLSGLIFGYCVLVRPIAIYLVPACLAIFVIRRRWQLLAPFGIAIMLLPGLWVGRNAFVFGNPALSAVSDNNLYYYNVAGTEARRLGIPIAQSRQNLARQLEAWPASESKWPYKREGELARSLIWEHPIAFVVYNGIDALNGFRPGFSFITWLGESSEQAQTSILKFSEGTSREIWQAFMIQTWPLKAVEGYMVFWIAFLIVGTLAGVAWLARTKRWMELIMLTMIPAILLFLPGSASNARFRAPTEGLLCIAAAAGSIWIYRLITTPRPSTVEPAESGLAD